jgi:hypothetical protein
MALDIKRRNGFFVCVGMPRAEYEYMNENSEGLCVACGYVSGCVEPDAERYECEHCGQNAVYGIQELLIMGRVEITGGLE